MGIRCAPKDKLLSMRRQGNRTNEDNLLKILAMHTSATTDFFRYFKELYASCDCPECVGTPDLPTMPLPRDCPLHFAERL
ncbi:MAG: hypothetical protein K2O70_03880, partial [Desulfovibrionaceae bacterium]|nr:hypothetical protein [Desulfovibrionaceae bacterium]